MSIARCRVIKTDLPLAGGLNGQALSSAAEIQRVCPSLGKILGLLGRSDPIGRLGEYAGVYGLTLSAGGYTPLDGANPVLGEVGTSEFAQVLTFTTYAGPRVPRKTVDAFVRALAAVHPWEHPVITVDTPHMWMPPPRRAPGTPGTSGPT